MPDSPPSPSPLPRPPRIRPRNTRNQAGPKMPVVDLTSAGHGQPFDTVTDNSDPVNQAALDFDPYAHDDEETVALWKGDRTKVPPGIESQFGPLIMAHVWSLRCIINTASIDTVIQVIKETCENWADETYSLPQLDEERQRLCITTASDAKIWLPRIAVDHSNTGYSDHNVAELYNHVGEANAVVFGANRSAIHRNLTGDPSIGVVGGAFTRTIASPARTQLEVLAPTVQPSKRQRDISVANLAMRCAKKVKIVGRHK